MSRPLLLSLVVVMQGCAGPISYTEWRKGADIGGIPFGGQPEQSAIDQVRKTHKGVGVDEVERQPDGLLHRLVLTTTEMGPDSGIRTVEFRYGRDGSLSGVLVPLPHMFADVAWSRWERVAGMRLDEVVGFTDDDKAVMRDATNAEHFAVIDPEKTIATTSWGPQNPVEALVRIPGTSSLAAFFPGFEPVEDVWRRLETAARSGAPLPDRDTKRISAALLPAPAAFRARLTQLEDALLATIPDGLPRDEFLRRVPRVADALVDLRLSCIDGPSRSFLGSSRDSERKDFPVRPELIGAANRVLTRVADGREELLALLERQSDAPEHDDVRTLFSRLSIAALAARLQTPPDLAQAIDVALRLVGLEGKRANVVRDFRGALRALEAPTLEAMKDAEAEALAEPGAALRLGLAYELLLDTHVCDESRAVCTGGARRMLEGATTAFVPEAAPEAPPRQKLAAAIKRWVEVLPLRSRTLTAGRTLRYGVSFEAPTVTNTGRSRGSEAVTVRVQTGTVVEERVNPEHAAWERDVERAREQLEEGQYRLAHANDVIRPVTTRDVETTTSSGYDAQRGTLTLTTTRFEGGRTTIWETGRGLAEKRRAEAQAAIDDARRQLQRLDERRPTGPRSTRRQVPVYAERRETRDVLSWSATGEVTTVLTTPRGRRESHTKDSRSGLAPGGTWEQARQDFISHLEERALPPEDTSYTQAYELLSRDVAAAIDAAPPADQPILRFVFLPKLVRDRGSLRIEGESPPLHPVLGLPALPTWTAIDEATPAAAGQ